MDRNTDQSVPGGRKLKSKVRRILTTMDVDRAVEALSQLPLRRVISPLISFFYAREDILRWRAIVALGRITAQLADIDREAARVVMRRLMWNLNDESGGIGWGSPEAMGEIMAFHEGLAGEYASILISYAKEDGNYLESEALQRGLLWGIARLAGARPQCVQGAAPHLMPYLQSKDPALRGMAAHIMGLLKARETRAALERLREDDAPFQTWVNNRLVETRVSDMAEGAIIELGENGGGCPDPEGREARHIGIPDFA